MEKEGFRHSLQSDHFIFHHTRTQNPDGRDFSFKSHSHNLYEMYFFIEGNCDFTLDGAKYKLERGTFILIDRGLTHNILISSSDAPYERSVILFDEKMIPRTFEAELAKLLEKGIFLLGEEKINAVFALIGALENAKLSEISEFDRAAAVISSLILILSSDSSAEMSHNAVEDPLISDIIRFVNSNLGSEWRLSDLERELFRDKAYLNRRFKAVMGCGIWEYNLRKRIFSSREILFLTGSVNTAFEKSGFGDYSSFYRKYKKYIGTSPTEDLKNLKIEK